MNVFLFPRLSPLAVDRILSEAGENSHPTPTTNATQAIHPLATFGASGGSRIARSLLITIRTDLVEIASSKGFPDPNAGRIAKADFDVEASKFLATLEVLSSGEALRDDVWAYFATVLMPDVTNWRFGNASDRYRGGVRNTFQRLWLRGRCLDRGAANEDRWGLLRDLTEDALVQIFERPGLSADPELAKAVAEAWVHASKQYRPGLMEDIMRNTAIPILAMKEIRSIMSLSEGERKKLLDEIFEGAAQSLGEAEEPLILEKRVALSDAILERQDLTNKPRDRGLRSLFTRTRSRAN
jgi:hypothetical protein